MWGPKAPLFDFSLATNFLYPLFILFLLFFFFYGFLIVFLFSQLFHRYFFHCTIFYDTYKSYSLHPRKLWLQIGLYTNRATSYLKFGIYKVRSKHVRFKNDLSSIFFFPPNSSLHMFGSKVREHVQYRGSRACS